MKETKVTDRTAATNKIMAVEAAVQKTYKDTLFRMLFRQKDNLLSLYNALNQTAYTDTDSLEITTLENAIYMNYKNDISFVFDMDLMLYEHQSTVNPNMPLRDLTYVSRVLQGRVRDRNLYGSALIKIPAPKFVVFYNGTTEQPEQQTLKLSDAYEKEQENPELELMVTVYNINKGHNPALLEACSLLNEYAQYVDLVREYAKEMDLPDAVERAVDYCIKNGILADFLSQNRAEAIAMCIFEYDQEKHMNMEREEWRSRGIEEGIEIGQEKGISIGRKEGIGIGREEGIGIGREEGQREMLVKSVESLMNSLNLSLPDACQALQITVREYENSKKPMA
ncbi:MAG: hypothetical protein NC318_07695 [Blautia sp.]|nr:hypothetical protein [Blautia sp.]MCM1219879.1 hypothetical protein [Lachnospiraceae bacterium]